MDTLDDVDLQDDVEKQTHFHYQVDTLDDIDFDDDVDHDLEVK